MLSFKSLRALLATLIVFSLAACGGSSGDDGDNAYTSPYAGTTWSGSVGGGQTGSWSFTVAADARITGTVVTSAGTYTVTGGLLDSGVLTGASADSSSGSARLFGSVNGTVFTGTWSGDWGLVALNQGSSGSFNGSRSTGSGGGGSGSGACPWDPTAFYNDKQVASYNGATYTALRWVTPFGSAGAPLFNPASDTYNWVAGGTCGPTPYVTVESATCTRGVNADVVTMSGKALGGGVGDAIAAYTNLTDFSYSNENNFGLPGSSYSMTCSGGGFVTGYFTSATTPSYSVCVKTQVSSAPTSWSSTQTIAHSTTTIPISTAYVSKGQPLRATVFNVGAIVLGLDAVRSAGVAITGNCQ